MKVIILHAFIILINTEFLSAQEASGGLTFNHMAISVKDVNRSADFYGNVFKFQEITNRSKLEGVRWFAIGEGKELHLISIVRENIVLNKAIHLAFTTGEFDAFVARLTEMKIAYSDWPGTPNQVNIRADGMKQVFFQDPDGYWLEVNSVNEKK
jgi:lactoylglutathione lyase